MHEYENSAKLPFVRFSFYLKSLFRFLSVKNTFLRNVFLSYLKLFNTQTILGVVLFLFIILYIYISIDLDICESQVTEATQCNSKYRMGKIVK